jgi:hypothetical protein
LTKNINKKNLRNLEKYTVIAARRNIDIIYGHKIRRDLMTPPKLARNTPIPKFNNKTENSGREMPNVLKPSNPCDNVQIGDDFQCSGFYGLNCLGRHLGAIHVPLGFNERFDYVF